ncbi:hypothetical protein FACS189487_07120 [Campylobacterota bacterium]|nr:hypothetical protein FACS189487_07120 [Campylobacterota bacterium]
MSGNSSKSGNSVSGNSPSGNSSDGSRGSCGSFGFKPILDAAYIIVLGLALGSAVTLGALTAPVVFKAALYMDNPSVDLLASGSLMSEIFRRFAYFLTLVLIFIAVYEVRRFKLERRAATLAAAVITLIAGGAFAWYYTPEVLRMQELGGEAIASIHFASIHRQAEAVFKIFAASCFTLLTIRVMALSKA